VEAYGGAFVDTDPARRSDLFEARSDPHLVNGLTVRWTAGVSARIPAWRSDARVAAFTLVTDTDERITGDLWAKGRASRTPRSSILLRPRTGPPVSVWIHAGKTRPRLEITKLPSGIRSVAIATVGRGRDVIRLPHRVAAGAALRCRV
jgi:hypothetical protein